MDVGVGIRQALRVQCQEYELGSLRVVAVFKRERGCRLFRRDCRWQAALADGAGLSVLRGRVGGCWLAVKLRYDAAPRPQRIRWALRLLK